MLGPLAAIAINGTLELSDDSGLVDRSAALSLYETAVEDRDRSALSDSDGDAFMTAIEEEDSA
jgi:hypothetical protein